MYNAYRSGHSVSLKVNGEVVAVSMTLDMTGQAYFDTIKVGTVIDNNYYAAYYLFIELNKKEGVFPMSNFLYQIIWRDIKKLH